MRRRVHQIHYLGISAERNARSLTTAHGTTDDAETGGYCQSKGQHFSKLIIALRRGLIVTLRSLSDPLSFSQKQSLAWAAHASGRQTNQLLVSLTVPADYNSGVFCPLTATSVCTS